MRPSLATTLRLMKRILASRILRYGFVAATVAFGVDYVADSWDEIHDALAQIGIGASLAALACVLASLTAAMWVWRTLLAGLGSPLSFRVAGRVLFVGQLGKYLPGSVWPVLAQMELATEHDVPRHRTAAASVINMVVMLLAALLTGLVTLPFTRGVAQYWWAFLIAVPLVACLFPPALNAMMRFAFRVLKRPPLEHPLTGREIAIAMGWSFLSWLCYGLQIWVLMVRVGAGPAAALPLSVGAFAFAFAVGFVIVLAPAGAGFREVLLVALLSPAVGTGPATAITLVSRAATTLADAITAGAATVGYRREKQRGVHAEGRAAAGTRADRSAAKRGNARADGIARGQNASRGIRTFE